MKPIGSVAVCCQSIHDVAPKGERCGTCRYFRRLAANSGICHRYPPTEGEYERIIDVMDCEDCYHEWCGEWTPKNGYLEVKLVNDLEPIVGLGEDTETDWDATCGQFWKDLQASLKRVLSPRTKDAPPPERGRATSEIVDDLVTDGNATCDKVWKMVEAEIQRSHSPSEIIGDPTAPIPEEPEEPDLATFEVRMLETLGDALEKILQRDPDTTSEAIKIINERYARGEIIDAKRRCMIRNLVAVKAR